MNDQDREQTLDRRIQLRLATDRIYLRAANAHAQAVREREIEEQEEARLDREIEERAHRRIQETRDQARVLGGRHESFDLALADVDAGVATIGDTQPDAYGSTTIYGITLPNPHTWETQEAYEARTRISFADGGVWTTFLHLVVAKLDAEREPTVEESEGPNRVSYVVMYSGPGGRRFRLRRRVDGTWDAVGGRQDPSYISPGFDSRAALIRFLESGGAA